MSESTVSLIVAQRRQAVVALLLLPIITFSGSAVYAQQTQATDTDCQCRAPDGQMKNLGTVECVDIVGNKSLVRCEMSTNTPYWKKIDGIEGCPAA
ncbi:MAG: hypothetical protein AB8B79_12675 [Granulosicoccus sp.]